MNDLSGRGHPDADQRADHRAGPDPDTDFEGGERWLGLQDNRWSDCSPVPRDIGGEHGNTATGGEAEPPLYADVAALFEGGLPDPPAPVLLTRTDGQAIFYAGQVNLLFGDPESGKTLVAMAAAAEAMHAGRRVAFIDIDHNGLIATVSRFLDMSVKEHLLRDPGLFRYVEPEDKAHLLAVVADLSCWRPAVVVVDSIGELLPLMNLSSNSPDDFTIAHACVLKPCARAGAAVIAVDHLPKGVENKANGPTGTAAKRRAVGGVAIRVVVEEQFSPGNGGSAYLTINKDRHGGLRRACPPNPGKEQVAGLFSIEDGTDDIVWTITGPKPGEVPAHDRVDPADLAALDLLDPPPSSVRDVKARCQWRTSRAMRVLKEWRSRRSPPVPRERGTTAQRALRTRGTAGEHVPQKQTNAQVERVPLFPPYVSGNGEHTLGAAR